MIPLMISASSLALSCVAYSQLKKQQNIEEIYLEKLKQKQIELTKLYGYVRGKRNNVNKQKLYLERTNARNSDYHICSLILIEEHLKDIENCIQSMLDLEV